MKGPGLRLLVDVRRTWKCPRCGYEEHVGAQTTTVACPCCPGVAMKLNEQKRVYADELAKLRSRPKPDPVANDGEVIQEVIESQSDSAVISEPPPAEMLQPSAGDSQQIPKRRGARPHKQSRRGQHKQQQQQQPDQSPASENGGESDGTTVNQTPPESPDDPAPAGT